MQRLTVATPWRIFAKVKADPAGAGLEQLEASYGAEDRALKFAGLAEVNFGAQPLLHAVLSARQLDVDKFVAAKNEKDDKDAEPVRLLPGLRTLVASMPQPPIPAKVEFSSEQIMLGGRPLQNITAILHGDAEFMEHRPAGFSRARSDPGGAERHRFASRQPRRPQGGA